MAFKQKIMTVVNELQRDLDELYQNDSLIDKINKVCELLANCLNQGGRVFIFGNGGSAADAQHIAAEMIGRFKKERAAYPVEALTVNTSVLTALANDYDYTIVFSRQIEALGKPGDVCIGLSTSGNSPNVIKAIQVASSRGMQTVTIVGEQGGSLKGYADICLQMPSDNTPRIQELTILVGHIICEIVEEKLVSGGDKIEFTS